MYVSTKGTATTTEAQSGHEDGAIEDTQEAPQSLSKDDLFHVLQNQRRRRVLNYLQTVEGQVEMRDIAEQVAAWEHDTTVQALTSEQRQRVYIALYQSHLPKLDEMGVLNYHQSRGIVERTPLADQFDPYLDVGDESGRDAPVMTAEPGTAVDAEATFSSFDSTNYYGGATAVGVLLTGAAWAGFAPTAVSSYLSLFIVGMFALVTLAAQFSHLN
jgi:hypothetical protein